MALILVYAIVVLLHPLKVVGSGYSCFLKSVSLVVGRTVVGSDG